MPPLDNHKSRLEKLEQKLYSIDGVKSKDRSVLKPQNYQTENNWQQPENKENNFDYAPKKKLGVFGFILIVAGLFFVGSLSYAGYVFFSGTQSVSGDDVDIKIVGPVSIGGGEELSLDVVVSSNNSIPIELVDLFAEYPEGSKNPKNLGEELRRTTIDLGNIPAGSIKRQTVKVSLFGEEGINQKLQFYIQYRIPGSNAIFEKRKNFDIALSASPVRLAVSGLQEISAGQPIELDIKFNSNSAQVLKNVMIVAEYPFGFKFENSDRNPTYDNNIWVINELKPNEEINFKIKGKIDGQNQEDRIFRFNAGLVKDTSPEEIGVLFTTVIHDTKIQKAFIDLALSFSQNSSPVTVFNSGEYITGEVNFINNTNDLVKNLIINLELIGTVLDETSVTVESGFYRSIDNTIVWNRETDQEFDNIEPRESKRVSFRFKTLELSSGNINLRNPQIDINAKVTGTRISTNNTEEQVATNAFKTIKVLSDTPIYAYTHYDKGPFTNSGPIPPRADIPTKYTVEFNASNNSNDLENAKIVATLPSYVAWQSVFSPNFENVTFDPVTRKMVWNIGKIPAGTGYIKPAKQLFVQVELTPSISQIGQMVDLMSAIDFSATDTFTNTNIYDGIRVPNTRVKDYPVADGHENVVE